MAQPQQQPSASPSQEQQDTASLSRRFSLKRKVATILLVAVTAAFLALTLSSLRGTRLGHDALLGENGGQGSASFFSTFTTAKSEFSEEMTAEDERALEKTEEESQHSGADDTTSSTPFNSSSGYRPHVLFVIMDDLGSYDLGIHGTGIRTPVADQLAREGLYLKQYYVHPCCTPTRIAIYTGRFPHSMGFGRPLGIPDTHGIPLDEELLPRVLRRGGYVPHIVGKWHVGHARYEYLPTFRGFESFFGFAFSGEQDNFDHTRGDAYDMRYEEGENCGEDCAVFVDERGNYSSTVFARESIRVIEEHVKMHGPKPETNGNHHPLFLVLSYAAVHRPIQVPPEYTDMYKGKEDWDDKRKLYGAMCTAADDSLDEVLKALKSTGMWDDTLVVYTSDNGAPLGGDSFTGGSNYPLKQGKGHVWEGGVFADGIVSGPARSKLGIIGGNLTHLFHAVDWLPTLAEIAGAVPNTGKKIHGVSQLEGMRGGGPARTNLYLGYSNRNPLMSAYRDGDWKVMYEHNSKRRYLFNVRDDPTESSNLADMYRNISDDIFEKFVSFRRENIDGRKLAGEKCTKPLVLGRTPWNAPARVPWC